MEVTNESASELFDPHWHPGGDALAFTLSLQRRFYTPVFVWSAHTGQLKTLEARSLKALLPSRYPAWGTTTEFARWSGPKPSSKSSTTPPATKTSVPIRGCLCLTIQKVDCWR